MPRRRRNRWESRLRRNRSVRVTIFPTLHHGLVRLHPVFDPLPLWRFCLPAHRTVPCSSKPPIGSYLMSPRSQPVWQRSSSQLYIVCTSLLCTFSTTRTIRRNLVAKSPRGRVAMWVPCIYHQKASSPDRTTSHQSRSWPSWYSPFQRVHAACAWFHFP